MNKLKKIYNFFSPIFLQNKKLFFFFTSSFLIGNVIANVVSPIYYKKIIDEAASQFSSGVYSFDIFVTLTLSLAVVLLVASLGRRIGSYFYSRFDARASNAIHDYSFDKITNQSYSFFSSNFIGTLSGKINRLSTNFRAMIEILFFDFTLLFFDVAITLVILFNQNTQLGFVFLSFLVVFIVYSTLFIKKQSRLDAIRAQKGSQRSGVLSDILTNILNVKIFSAKPYEVNYYHNVVEELKKSQLDTWLFGDRIRIYKNILFIIFEVGIMGASVYLFTQQEITLGTLSLVQMYTALFIANAWHLDRAMKGFIEQSSDTSDAIDIVMTKALVEDPKKAQTLAIKNGEIRFNNVSFSYPEGDHVFEDFNLHISEGESVGLVGMSGSGKTTVTKLLLRFFDVDSGSISIDGQDIKNVKQDDLRSCISYIPQESILFHRSVYENIRYGNMQATKKEVRNASVFAHADEFISEFEQGYNTEVGERGVKLSGGQRQRLAIARSMLKGHVPILVMDEATSSLDSVSERYIQESFEKLMKGRTTIVIAHRLSTIQKMDRIIVLKKGKIIEDGSHKELLKKNGYYTELWESQMYE